VIAEGRANAMPWRLVEPEPSWALLYTFLYTPCTVLSDMNDVRLLSHSQVAERLGIDRRTVSKMIGLGQLPAVWVGARMKVPERAVEDFERVALAANVGTQTALRLFALLAADQATAPHVTGEDGR
jgi:excisionase family DNA binding protein